MPSGAAFVESRLVANFRRIRTIGSADLSGKISTRDVTRPGAEIVTTERGKSEAGQVMDSRASRLALTILTAFGLAGCRIPTAINVVKLPEPGSGFSLPQPASVPPAVEVTVTEHTVKPLDRRAAAVAKKKETDSTDPAPNSPPSTQESLAQISRILQKWQRENASGRSGEFAPDDAVLTALNDTVNSVPADVRPESAGVRTVSAEFVDEKPESVPAEIVDVDESPQAFPVDLPTVLRLTGGRNWAVQLAWERMSEAQANVDAAEALWIPSLNFGIGATKHEGQIQSTTGQVIDVSRNSLFLGGGMKTANAPMTGGSGGPARLFVDLSIADALFQPLVSRQLSNAARSQHAVEFNNTQRDAAVAYFDLVAAQGAVSIGRQNLADGEALLAMTEAFVAAGKASPAEVSRVHVIVANQKQALVEADLRLRLASAELVRIVRLDPSQISAEALLYSADDHLLPLELVPEAADVESLIAQGQQARPEVAEQHARAQASLANARSAELRPFIPNLNVAMSAGGFGGGQGSDIDNFDGRADFDAILVWEVRNFGLGESAARNQTTSRYRQAVLGAHRVQDQIAAEVRNGWHQVQAGRQRLHLARQNVEDATRVLQMNLERIRGLEGLPLEAIQALNAVATARLTFLEAIVSYNKAQAELLRAIGRPVQQAV